MEKDKAANGHACFYCKRKVKLEMDHLQAITKGGRHVPENVVPACRHCNASKGDGDKPKSLPPELRT